jgi:hypothetical protein
MAYSKIPTRSSTDTNASADINQLQDNISVKSPRGSDSSADYTILDTDDLGVFRYTTGSGADIPVVLPSASSNVDREITFVKVDSGSAALVITGTINGYSNWKLFHQWAGITVKSNGTNWNTINVFGNHDVTDTDTTSRSQTTPVTATWYQVSGSNLQVTVDPGQYILKCFVTIEYSVSGSSGDAAAFWCQLDTSGTPGSGLIGPSVAVNMLIVGANYVSDNTATITTGVQTFAASTTIRPSMRGTNAINTPTLGTFSHRNDLATASIIATRIA